MSQRSDSRLNSRYDVVFYIPFLSKIIAHRREVIPTGGAETQIYLLTRALSAAGFSVGVIVFDVPGGVPSSYDGVDVILRSAYRGSLGEKRSLPRRVIGSAAEAISIIAEVARIPSRTVVQRTAGLETCLVWLGCKLSNKRFAWSSASISDFSPGESFSLAPYASAFRFAVKSADSVIVQTEEQVMMCESAFSRTPSLIPSLAEPAGTAPIDRGPFLWIGRTVDYKRPLEFLDLAEAAPDLNFMMVAVPTEGADPDLIAEVQSRGAKLKNVEMLDPRPRAELMGLIESATAIVSTSIWEGMPNIFLEGWARGVPALSLHFDPDGLIQECNLGIFAQGKPKEFLAGARRLRADRGLRESLSASCRDYIAGAHSPEVIAERWSAALKLRDRNGVTG